MNFPFDEITLKLQASSFNTRIVKQTCEKLLFLVKLFLNVIITQDLEMIVQQCNTLSPTSVGSGSLPQVPSQQNLHYSCKLHSTASDLSNLSGLLPSTRANFMSLSGLGPPSPDIRSGDERSAPQFPFKGLSPRTHSYHSLTSSDYRSELSRGFIL